MNMKKIISRISKSLYKLFIESKKLIRNNNDKRYIFRALASLFVFVYLIGHAVREFFFEKHFNVSVLVCLLTAYVTFSYFDEHVVLTIAMFLCLFFSYDAIAFLLKGEIKNRNDQIYKEFINNTKEQVEILTKKKKLLKNLETFSSKIKQIKNSSFLSRKKNVSKFESFKPIASLKKSLEYMIYEELYYLDFVYTTKNNIFEKLSIHFDNDLEFTNSKLEEISVGN